MIARNGAITYVRGRGVPMKTSLVACCWEPRLASRRNFTQKTAPVITGTLPAGGKGMAVSQYAEVRFRHIVFCSLACSVVKMRPTETFSLCRYNASLLLMKSLSLESSLVTRISCTVLKRPFLTALKHWRKLVSSDGKTTALADNLKFWFME